MLSTLQVMCVLSERYRSISIGMSIISETIKLEKERGNCGRYYLVLKIVDYYYYFFIITSDH